MLELFGVGFLSLSTLGEWILGWITLSCRKAVVASLASVYQVALL